MRDGTASPGPARRAFPVMTTTRLHAETAALRRVLLLAGAYAVLSVLTLVVIVLFRNDHAMVTDAVWVRATLVVASSLLTFAFARSAARGSRKGFLRLRIVAAVMLVAIAVIVALPGFLPVWLRIEQAGCGLLLLGVTVIANGRLLRSRFTGAR
jgi:hypothetical protein